MNVSLPSFPSSVALTLLRIYLGITFITHGAARLYYASVADFGGFLDSKGFMIGEVIAWTITIGELIGGTLLLLGIGVRYILIFHFIVIVGGIFLVHLPNGWFVVGHGAGGVEYSFLILAVILVLFSNPGRKIW